MVKEVKIKTENSTCENNSEVSNGCIICKYSKDEIENCPKYKSNPKACRWISKND